MTKKNKNFSAKINTRIFITPQGKVQNVKMNSSTKNKDFNSCIRDIIYTFNFPKRSDQWIIAIKHPFLFSASNPYGVYDLPLKVPLSRKQIDSSINKKAKILKNCYQRELKKDPKFEGKVLVVMRVNNKGKVIYVNLKTIIKKRTFLKCLKKSIYKISFPSFKTGGTVDIKYPLAFSSK